MPMTSGRMASRAASAAPISVPGSIVPVSSMVTCTWIGTSTTRRGHGPPAADHGGLGAEQVELRLHEEDIDAALEEAVGLHLVGVAQGGEADLAERGELGARADRAGHQAAVPVGHLAGNARGGQVELVGSLADAVLAERYGEGAEAGGLHDVDADLEEGVVHAGDDLGTGDDEQLVAALEGLTAEVVGAELERLDVRAEGAVVDDDALRDEVEVPAATHGPTRLPAVPRGGRTSRNLG